MSEHLTSLAHQAWVRAAESTTPPLLDATTAQRAGRDALHRLGAAATLPAWLGARARLASASLPAGSTPATQLLAGVRWLRRLGLLLVLVALGVGAAANGIGPDGRLNLLAPPLLGLLAWNGVVYAALLAAALRGAAARRPGTGGGLHRLVLRGVEGLSRWTQGRRPAGPARAAAVAQAQAWATLSTTLRPVLAQRLTVWLHLAAAALALGAVAAMYVRGVAFAFHAGWDSTFLSPSGVHTLLSTVLGPASAWSGIGLPNVTELAALRFGAGPGEPAARWMHLHALTVLAVVGLPRLLLAGAAAWRARRLLRTCALPLDDAAGARLQKEWLMSRADLPGVGLRVWVQPLQYTLTPAQARALPGALTALLPLPWQVHTGASLPVGDELPAALVSTWRHPPGPPPGLPPQALVLLASLSATPEAETHGRCIRALAAQAAAAGLGGPDPAGSGGAPQAAPVPLWLLLDGAAFTQRFGPARRAERAAAWRALLQASGGERPVHLHLIDLEPTA